MRLSRIWRIRQIEEGVILDLPNSSYPTQPHSLIVLLFIQNNSWFKNKLKHAFLRRCQVHLGSGFLEDKGLFRSASIVQIADVVRRVVFSLCFWTTVCRKTSKVFRRMLCHSCFHNQNNSTSSPGLIG